ncbi:MAG: hypothetical protein ACEQSE_14970 [Candidatus Aquirickettsiella gammari]
MELEQTLLGQNAFRLTMENGQVLPDPNLIWNIDHMVGFIHIERKAWESHVKLVNLTISESNTSPSIILLKKENVRVYMKGLFNVATYYITCVYALENLIKQLNKIKKITHCNSKPERLNENRDFHEKILKLRDKSFIHQDSNMVANEMNKRALMFWSPELVCANDESPNCESYTFGNSKWFIDCDGNKTETDLDIEIHGFTTFVDTVLSELDVRIKRIENYFLALQEELSKK